MDVRTCLQGGLKRQRYGILKNLSGVLRPGTATLLLGPPGAGKTVFLQVRRGPWEGPGLAGWRRRVRGGWCLGEGGVLPLHAG